MPLIEKPFLFVRHGETFHNRARIVAGSKDIVLTPKGKQQAIDAGKLLDGWTGQVVASSSHWRARQTAMLALPGKEILPFDGLRERCWGALELGPIVQPMPYLEPPEDAESWQAFVTRVEQSLNYLLENYELPVVFAHSGVFRAIRYLTHGYHEGSGATNAAPMKIMPPDEAHDEWRFVNMAE